MRVVASVALGALGALVLAGCTAEPDEQDAAPPAATTCCVTPSPETGAAEPPALPPDPRRVDPERVRLETARQTVHHLAELVGPRPGTSRAFHRAADWVGSRLTELGWRVERQSFRVPGGTSVAGPTEGLPVEGGRSVNVIATRGDVVPGEPWLVVGAHLDTVPTSPGAEDNASGIGALLAVAEAVGARRTRLPVVLIAFGAEEPRGPSDDDHHYGSRTYVSSLAPAERRALRGMVSLDRVGVGEVVPVGSVEDGDPLRAQFLRAAARVGVPTVAEAGQRSSDHWSFVREGLPGVRLGSTPYAGYHSPDDVRAVVDPEQVARVARLVVAWLR